MSHTPSGLLRMTGYSEHWSLQGTNRRLFIHTLPFLSRACFLTANLLILTSLVSWISWDFPKLPSSGSFLLNLFPLTFHDKKQEETKPHVDHPAEKSQLNIQTHHLQVLLSTELWDTVQYTFSRFPFHQLPRTCFSFPSGPYRQLF